MSSFVQRARFRRDHRWAPEHMSPYLESDLGSSARVRMERHLRDCEECRRVLSGLRSMLDALSVLPAAGGEADALRIAAAVRGRLGEPPAT